MNKYNYYYQNIKLPKEDAKDFLTQVFLVTFFIVFASKVIYPPQPSGRLQAT